jgi:hypothetical protein
MKNFRRVAHDHGGMSMKNMFATLQDTHKRRRIQNEGTN